MSNTQQTFQSDSNNATTSMSTNTNTNTDADTMDDVEAGMNNVTLIGGPPNLFRQQTEYGINDLIEQYDPNGICITGTNSTVRGAQQVKYSLPVSLPVIYPGGEHTGEHDILSFNGVKIVSCTEMSDIEKLTTLESTGEISDEDTVIVMSNLLSLSVEMETLETRMEGINAYTDAFDETLNAAYIHVSGAIQAGYCREWDGVEIHGCGMSGENGQQRHEFIALTVSEDGVLMDETIDSSQLGLQSIENVGPKTAERFRDNGYVRREDIADAGIDELKAIEGMGEKTAKRIKQSAEAIVNGEVVPTDESVVPGDDPVFIDIETDGLNPTAVWLIGVQDGVDGNYMSFIETDEPGSGEAVKEFMLWFSTNAADRTLIAWNGWEFDFPVLRKHIQQECPEHIDVWKRASKRDPLRWARDLDNAILPGRTNKLEHVAEGLGWRGHETGLSGKEVARRYRAWMEEQTPATELDWEMHKQYCRDDVNALAYIYESMEDASRLAGDISTSRDIEEETTQSGLFDGY